MAPFSAVKWAENGPGPGKSRTTNSACRTQIWSRPIAMKSGCPARIYGYGQTRIKRPSTRRLRIIKQIDFPPGTRTTRTTNGAINPTKEDRTNAQQALDHGFNFCGFVCLGRERPEH